MAVRDPCGKLLVISADAEDFRKSLEWRMFEQGCDARFKGSKRTETFYYQPKWLDDFGRFAPLHDFAMVFDQTAAKTQDLNARFKTMLHDILRQMETQLDEKDKHAWLKKRLKNIDGEWWLEARTAMLREQAAPPLSQPGRQGKRGKSFGSHFNILSDSPLQTSYTFQEDPVSSTVLRPEVEPVGVSGSFVCEFYNVLWIERKNGIAYRRACGWVPKHIWKAHATGPVELQLG